MRKCSNSLLVAVGFSLVLLIQGSQAQLNPSFYQSTCPGLQDIVTKVLKQAYFDDFRILPSLIRLHFHDCFVHGCDGSVLLSNTATIRSEKDAPANKDSLRGFEVVDAIKSVVESVCPNAVSCADILALAAEISVVLAGGSPWIVMYGRRDSKNAYFDETSGLPNPSEDYSVLQSKFLAVNLFDADLVALSGAHTFGRAHCRAITDRLYNYKGMGSDPSLNSLFVLTLKQQCPQNGDGSVLLNLDYTTPFTFDNKYYSNIQTGKGLFHSDQELLSTRSSAVLVNSFANNQAQFFQSFAQSMSNMGNISPLTGFNGEIRKDCQYVN